MPSQFSQITTIVFDVGEILVDETRQWHEWADWLEIPSFTFFAVLGGVIARGGHHREVFDMLRPGFDFNAARSQRQAEGWRYRFGPNDLYPDVLPALNRLRRAGLTIGIAANQPLEAADSLRECGIAADFMLMSAELGAEKPDSAFFHAIGDHINERNFERIAYVGDRIDNDIIPAAACGMSPIFLKRGPWAYLQQHLPGREQAVLETDSLLTLVDRFDPQRSHCTKRSDAGDSRTRS